MTKRVLAAQLATTSETLSRTFAKLRGEGLLEVCGATVHVPNPTALHARFRKLLGES
jgi:CRP/FNR family transcriptional regulator